MHVPRPPYIHQQGLSAMEEEKKKEKEEITINIRFRDKNVCGYKTIEFVPSRVVSIIVIIIVITESPKRYSHFVSPYGAWLRFMCAT